MRIGELDVSTLARRLAGEGIALDLGAARVRVRARAPGLAEALRAVYWAYPVEDASGFFDITVRLDQPRGIRRFVRPQVSFFVDGERPFEPFPSDTHLPLLEWGINFCFAERCQDHLVLHAGVVERRGHAVMLPALPGSGKSTLTAALVCRGYRLLSDEFAVVRLSDGMAVPILKPIALKNESIDVIRAFAPGVVLGPRFPKTRKGTVAHMAPDEASVAARWMSARPSLIVFPKYAAGTELQCVPVLSSRAFTRLAVNSFNYAKLGPLGFDAVGDLVESCECYSIQYSSVDEAVQTIDELIEIVSEDEVIEPGSEALTR
ncbi:MAG: HprK-related kinase A [Burkholderiales bacterium]